MHVKSVSVMSGTEEKEMNGLAEIHTLVRVSQILKQAYIKSVVARPPFSSRHWTSGLSYLHCIVSFHGSDVAAGADAGVQYSSGSCERGTKRHSALSGEKGEQE